MIITTTHSGTGSNSTCTEDPVPPLSEAFARYEKSCKSPDNQPADKDEATWFEGAD